MALPICICDFQIAIRLLSRRETYWRRIKQCCSSGGFLELVLWFKWGIEMVMVIAATRRCTERDGVQVRWMEWDYQIILLDNCLWPIRLDWATFVLLMLDVRFSLLNRVIFNNLVATDGLVDHNSREALALRQTRISRFMGLLQDRWEYIRMGSRWCIEMGVDAIRNYSIMLVICFVCILCDWAAVTLFLNNDRIGNGVLGLIDIKVFTNSWMAHDTFCILGLGHGGFRHQCILL